MARRICSYCKVDLGPAAENCPGDTHGICGSCLEKQLAEIDQPPDIYRQDVAYYPTGVKVENRGRTNFYRFDCITDSSKLRLWRLARKFRPVVKKRRGRRGGNGKRRANASAVLGALRVGYAMAELVERVNNEVQE